MIPPGPTVALLAMVGIIVVLVLFLVLADYFEWGWAFTFVLPVVFLLAAVVVGSVVTYGIIEVMERAA